jgi:hypothetical protein
MTTYSDAVPDKPKTIEYADEIDGTPTKPPNPRCKSCAGTGKIRRSYKVKNHENPDGPPREEQLSHPCGCTNPDARPPAPGHKGIPGTAKPWRKPTLIRPRKNTQVCAACDKRRPNWNMTAVKSDADGIWNVCAGCLRKNRAEHAEAQKPDENGNVKTTVRKGASMGATEVEG